MKNKAGVIAEGGGSFRAILQVEEARSNSRFAEEPRVIQPRCGAAWRQQIHFYVIGIGLAPGRAQNALGAENSLPDEPTIHHFSDG